MDETASGAPTGAERQDSVVSHSDLEFTTVDEKPSNYVSALVRYDSIKFEKNMNTTGRDILNESCSDYYSSILNVASFDNTTSSGCICDAVTDLLRVRSFELADDKFDGQFSYEEIPESHEFGPDSSDNCDICYSPLGNLSMSMCKICEIRSHTNCLLNSCNTITELVPINEKTDTTDGVPYKVNNYEYVCKICLANLSPPNTPTCCICNQRGGVMNYTDKLYYHPFCVYYSYDVLYTYFNNNLILTNVQMFKRLLNSLADETKASSHERKCKLCGNHVGVPIKCKYITCNNYIHPRCIMMNQDADKNGILERKQNHENSGLLVFMMIKYTSNLGGRNMLFKASFCSEHTSKKYINYSIYKQLVNQSILTMTSGTTYSKYRHVIDNILSQYFVKNNNLNFKINTSINIPQIVDSLETSNKRRKLDNLVAKIESKLTKLEDNGKKSKEGVEKEYIKVKGEEDIVTFEGIEAPIEKKVDQEKIEEEKKEDKDKKEEEDLKVQKVLWQKFDIFNPITFNPFTSTSNRKEGISTVAQSSWLNIKPVGKTMSPHHEETHDDAPLLSVLLYNKEVKDNILPLNSILFDNIKSNKELALCYQQKILTSCHGLMEYLNLVNDTLQYRDEDELEIFVLFENVISNYLLVYAANRKSIAALNHEEFRLQMQYDLKTLISSSVLRDSVIKDNPLFNNINVYGIKDDIKYIHSILSNSGGSSNKNRHFIRRLRLANKIKLNNFEMELIKRSILELRNMNYIKLIVVNSLTTVPGSGANGGMCGPNGYMEEKYVNYIDWNKIINNIKNLYECNDSGTPLKYDEYRLLTGFNTDFNRDKEQNTSNQIGPQVNYLNNEYKAIEGELDLLNRELIEIKNKLHEKILEYCSENSLDQDKHIKDKNQLNKYEFNEYYYYVLYNMKKLFSVKNRLNLPDLDRREVEMFKKTISSCKKVAGEHQVVENVEDDSKFCQVCYNEEENNINVLIKCTRCLIVVHKYCYNVPIAKIIRNTEYLCNRCEHEKKQLSSQYQSNYKKFSILCSICKRGSGPLTRAKDDWYHPFCYLILMLTPKSKTYAATRKVRLESSAIHQKNEPYIKYEETEYGPSNLKEDYEFEEEVGDYGQNQSSTSPSYHNIPPHSYVTHGYDDNEDNSSKPNGKHSYHTPHNNTNHYQHSHTRQNQYPGCHNHHYGSDYKENNYGIYSNEHFSSPTASYEDVHYQSRHIHHHYSNDNDKNSNNNYCNHIHNEHAQLNERNYANNPREDGLYEAYPQFNTKFMSRQDTMESKSNTEQTINSKENPKAGDRRCVVCGIQEGVFVECNQCTNKFHPFCAYFHGFKFQLVNKNAHVPSFSSTRVVITCNEHFTMADIDDSYDDYEDNNEISRNKREVRHKLKHGKRKELIFKPIGEDGWLDELEDRSGEDMELITTVMNNRYRRYINRDVNDTIYDKDKKKRIIQSAPANLDEVNYDTGHKECPDNTCNVCFKDNGEICCTACNKYVHRACYPQQVNNTFKCDHCVHNSQSNKEKKGIYCYICLNSDAMLIKLCDNMYYHISCKIIYNCSDYLSQDIYYVPDNDKYQLYTKEEQLKKERIAAIEEDMECQHDGSRPHTRESGCNVCLGLTGFMVCCYKNNCNLKFHPNCAIKSKLIMEPYFTPQGLKYISLCHEHSLLHNTVGEGLKKLLRLRVQLLMTSNIFKDLYDQNVVLKSMLRKRNEIYNVLYPLDKIYKS